MEGNQMHTILTAKKGAKPRPAAPAAPAATRSTEEVETK
jgi:hypothetical protein